jgi:hypothetical protein
LDDPVVVVRARRRFVVLSHTSTFTGPAAEIRTVAK